MWHVLARYGSLSNSLGKFMERLLNRQDVERRIGLTRSTLYRLMRCDDFPLPVQIGPRSFRWLPSEIEAWIETRPRSNGERTQTTAQA